MNNEGMNVELSRLAAKELRQVQPHAVCAALPMLSCLLAMFAASHQRLSRLWSRC